MKKIIGTTLKPRISIFRSNLVISAQAIDDSTGTTLATASSAKLTGTPVEKALLAGKALAESLKAKKISEVVYDRNGNKYHGNVAAFAQGMRDSGIKF